MNKSATSSCSCCREDTTFAPPCDRATSQTEPFDETNWTGIDGGEMSAYVKSKALAERAAWDFIAAEGGALELTTVNPAGIFGPALGTDYSGSLDLIKRLLNGMPGCPQLYFGVAAK